MNVIRTHHNGLSLARLSVICVTCGVAFATLGLRASADEVLLVLPPELENVEGDEFIFTALAVPSNGFRAQWAHLASEFSGLPEGHNTIVSMAWRPDHGVTFPNTFTLGFELRLSTTSAAPGTLSETFAENIGNDETLVYSGPLTLETDGSGGPPEGPRPFDYRIEFERPFVYVPSPGNNLLVDFSMLAPSEGRLLADAQDTGVIQSVGVVDASLPTANLTNTKVMVTQFAFVPEPSTFVIASLGSVVLLAWRRKKISGRSHAPRGTGLGVF